MGGGIYTENIGFPSLKQRILACTMVTSQHIRPWWLLGHCAFNNNGKKILLVFGKCC